MFKIHLFFAISFPLPVFALFFRSELKQVQKRKLGRKIYTYAWQHQSSTQLSEYL